MSTIDNADEILLNAQRMFGRPRRCATVLVCGYTGCGKTSLINAVFGDDVVPPDAIGNTGAPQTSFFDRYPPNPSPDDSICIYDSKGMEQGQTEDAFRVQISQFIEEKRTNPDIDEHIHIVWYTISCANNVTDCDLRLIQTIFNPNEVIVVITQADLDTRDNRVEQRKQHLIDNGISPNQIVVTSDERGGSIGCAELVQKTYDMLPDAYQNAFVEKQRLDKKLDIGTIEANGFKADQIIEEAKNKISGKYGMTLATELPRIYSEMIWRMGFLYDLSKQQLFNHVLPFANTNVPESLDTVAARVRFFATMGIKYGNNQVTIRDAKVLTEVLGRYVKDIVKRFALENVENKYPNFNPAIPFDPNNPPILSIDQFQRFWKTLETL